MPRPIRKERMMLGMLEVTSSFRSLKPVSLPSKEDLGAVDAVGVVHDDEGTGEDTDHDAGH